MMESKAAPFESLPCRETLDPRASRTSPAGLEAGLLAYQTHPEGPACGEEMAAFLRGLADRIEVSSFEVREFVARGREVVSFGSFAGTSRSTRRSVASDWAIHWQVEAGRLRMAKAFVDAPAAYASA